MCAYVFCVCVCAYEGLRMVIPSVCLCVFMCVWQVALDFTNRQVTHTRRMYPSFTHVHIH